MSNLKLFIVMGMGFLLLSACTTKSEPLDVPVRNLSCVDLLPEIERVEIALTKAENLADDYHDGINNVRTGGTVGVCWWIKQWRWSWRWHLNRRTVWS